MYVNPYYPLFIQQCMSMCFKFVVYKNLHSFECFQICPNFNFALFQQTLDPDLHFFRKAIIINYTMEHLLLPILQVMTNIGKNLLTLVFKKCIICPHFLLALTYGSRHFKKQEQEGQRLSRFLFLVIFPDPKKSVFCNYCDLKFN